MEMEITFVLCLLQSGMEIDRPIEQARN